MRIASLNRRRLLSAALLAALLSGGVAEAKAKREADTPPELTIPAVKRIAKTNRAFMKEFVPRFLLGAGAVIAAGLAYWGVAWVVRAPCRRCGSKRIRITGSGPLSHMRCLDCGAEARNG